MPAAEYCFSCPPDEAMKAPPTLGPRASRPLSFVRSAGNGNAGETPAVRVGRGLAGGLHGSKFRHRGFGLAAARQLGSLAQIPHRTGARDDEKARPRRPALHVR